MHSSFKIAYNFILNVFKDILPLIFKSLKHNTLVRSINHVFSEQYEDEDEGGEKDEYLHKIDEYLLDFARLFIPEATLVKKPSKKNPRKPHPKVASLKGSIDFTDVIANSLTDHIVKILSTKWAKQYMSFGFYEDYNEHNKHDNI